MTDYYPLLAAALAQMAQNTSAERQAVYARARSALIGHLQSAVPPLPQRHIMDERLALEEAIRRVEEASASPPPVSAAGAERASLRKLADLVDHDETYNTSRRRAAPTWANLLTSLAQKRPGTRFELAGGTSFVAGPSGTPADEAIATDSLMQAAQARIERTAGELVRTLVQTSGRRGSGWLDRAAARFAELVGRPAPVVSSEIDALWGLYVSLGAYLERGQTTRGLSTGMLVTLGSDVSELLRDLLALAEPWICSFPTGLLLRDEGRLAKPPLTLIEPATRLCRSAEQAGLARDDAIWIALDAGSRDTEIAALARQWGLGSVSNLGVAMMAALGHISHGQGEEASEKALHDQTAKRLERVVLENADALIALLSYLPADAHSALRGVLEALHHGAVDDA